MPGKNPKIRRANSPTGRSNPHASPRGQDQEPTTVELQGGLADHGSQLTSYDIAKALAIVIMLIDHVGLFFVQDNPWLRVIGRQCVPIWLFLVGYSRSQQLDPNLLIGAGIIVATRIVTGATVLPLNILVTVFVYRVANRVILRRCLTSVSFDRLLILGGIVVLIAPYSKGAFLYGAVGYLFSICGFAARHSTRRTASNAVFFVAVAVFFGMLQGQLFHFSQTQTTVMTVGIVAVMTALCYFRPIVYATGYRNPLALVTMILGRYTMQIYVLNWVVFLLVDRYLLPDPGYNYSDTFRWRNHP